MHSAPMPLTRHCCAKRAYASISVLTTQYSALASKTTAPPTRVVRTRPRRRRPREWRTLAAGVEPCRLDGPGRERIEHDDVGRPANRQAADVEPEGLGGATGQGADRYS